MPEMFSINEKSQSGKKVELTNEFEQYAASQWLNKESIQYVKTQIENYWNRYIDTGGKVEFAKKSILWSIERELWRAKSDLRKDSLALPITTPDKSTPNMANNPWPDNQKSWIFNVADILTGWKNLRSAVDRRMNWV